MAGNELFPDGLAPDTDEPGDSQMKSYKRLVAAKFLLHIRDFEDGMSGRIRKREDYERAQRWFLADDDSPFTFVWTCELLKLDPKRIRSALAEKWRKKRGTQSMGNQAQGARILSAQPERAEAVPA